MAFGFQPQPPGDWPTDYTRGECPLTGDLKRVWAQQATSEGHPGIPHRRLKKGDLVLVRVPGATGLKNPWSPPKRVLQMVGPATADVEDVGRAHVTRLKFFQQGGGM